MKLFPNFTSIPFDYLLISWVTNYVSNREFLTFLSSIVSIENSTLLIYTRDFEAIQKTRSRVLSGVKTLGFLLVFQTVHATNKHQFSINKLCEKY